MKNSDYVLPANTDQTARPNAAHLQAEIARLHHELDVVALQISQCDGPTANQLWHSLAHSRAYLATALEQSRHLKDEQLRSILNWEI